MSIALQSSPAPRHAPAPAAPDASPRPRTDRRRLLFLITQFGTGGAQAQLLLRLRYLDRERYAPVVCVLTRQAGYMLDRLHALDVRVVQAGLEQLPTPYAKLAHLRRIIDAERPDVVTSILCWDHTYGTLAALHAGVPLVVAEIQNERNAVRRAFTRGFRVAEAVCLTLGADAIVGCSEQVRRSYAGALPLIGGRTRAIANAIATDEAPARLHPRLPAAATVTIGTMGRVMAQKNHALLVEAAAILCARRSEARVVVAGDGPLRADLEARVRSLGLADRIVFAGETTSPFGYLASLDVFVLSSSWEGLPLVALEAMACGVPVVSTDVGGVSEVVAHERTGLLCPPGNPEALAAALERLIDDPRLRASLGEAGRERVRAEFDVRGHVRRWERLYETAPRRRVPAGCAAAAPGPVRAVAPPRPHDVDMRRILLLRFCPLPRARAIADLLRTTYPHATIDVLCQSDWADRVREALPAADVIPYGTGAFSLRKLGVRALRRLRAARYDVVVLPYNLGGENDYRQAEAAACLAGRGRVECYAAWSDNVHPMGTRTWAAFAWGTVLRQLFLIPAAAFVARALAAGIWRRLTRRAAAEAIS